MFTHIYEARYGDLKNFCEIREDVVLDFVQDISIKDSERAGFGIDVLNNMKLAWLLQGINLKITGKLRANVPFEVSTGVKTLKGATSERVCIIKQEGELVAQTVSNWFLFDIEKNKISRVLPEMQSAYEFESFDEEFSFAKPDVISDAEKIYEVRVSKKDIDTNNHLNNQKSAQMLMDALPFDYSFDSSRILYKKPAFLGNILSVCTKKLENGYYVHLENNDGEICVVGMFE